MAQMNPKAMLIGENPRLIDEWQKAPDIWNQVKDGGAGRIAPLRMRPLTLWESKESKGTVSLKDLFDGGEGVRMGCMWLQSIC